VDKTNDNKNAERMWKLTRVFTWSRR